MVRALCLTVICMFGWVHLALADARVALVIGNSAYDHVAHLPNARNDAADIGDALERIGFSVTRGSDLDYREMRLILRDFARAARDAEMVIIYFAGHGIEIENTNYLIPVNAELRSDQDIDFEAVRLETAINAASASNGLKLVLVDACRNNPFLMDMIRTTATRSVGRGLARVDPGGVLVGYAARSGTLALDGDGRNSPYAQAVLTHIEEPGLELGKMFRKVRDTVFTLTEGYQEPFTYGSLPGEDIFLVPPIEVAALPQSRAPQPDNSFNDMLKEFAEAEKYGTLTRWNNFLAEFGDNEDNELVRIALARKSELEREKERQARSASRPLPFDLEYDAKGRAILNRDNARLVQTALAYMGHYTGPVDGDIGPMTQRAVATARIQNGLPPGTHIDRALLRTLPDVAAMQALRSDKAQVYDLDELPVGLEPRLENALRALGPVRVMFDYFDGRLYLAVDDFTGFGTFESANRKAMEAGGHLVTIQNAAENRFLYEFFSKDPVFIRTGSRGELFGPMIGLYQQPNSPEPRGGWTWVTGEPLTYTAWSPGNPDNFNGRQNRARFYLNNNLVRPGSPPRFWDDSSNHLQGLGYLIEIE